VEGVQNFNANLVLSSGPTTDFVQLEHGAWAKAVGAAKTMTKAEVVGCTGGVQIIRPAWVAVLGSNKVQVQSDILGMTYTKCQALVVQDKDFTQSAIKVTKETCGIRAIDKHLLTVLMLGKVPVQAEWCLIVAQ
jgi:hypothetical protein